MERQAVTVEIVSDEKNIKCKGTLSRKGNGRVIEYSEGGISSSVIVCDGSVTLVANGEISYSVVLAQDKRYMFTITTPFGCVNARAALNACDCSETDLEYIVSLVYMLEFEDGVSEERHMRIACFKGE